MEWQMRFLHVPCHFMYNSIIYLQSFVITTYGSSGDMNGRNATIASPANGTNRHILLRESSLVQLILIPGVRLIG